MSPSLCSIKVFQLTPLGSSLLGAVVAAKHREQKIPVFNNTFFVAARTPPPALLAALLLGEAKDVGMAIIRDALCNQHGDLLKHKYYCIRLHFFNIYSYGMQIAPGLQGRCWLAGQSCSWGKACWLWGLELHRRSCCHPDKGWASEALAAARQGCWSQA